MVDVDRVTIELPRPRAERLLDFVDMTTRGVRQIRTAQLASDSGRTLLSAERELRGLSDEIRRQINHQARAGA